MNTKKNLCIFAGIVISAALLFYGLQTHSNADLPQKVMRNGKYAFNYLLEAEEDALKSKMPPEAWENIAHGGLLGFPWQLAQSKEQAEIIDQFYSGNYSRSGNYGPFLATWRERGPWKIPGRVTSSAVLPLQNRIYLLTDGGYIFRGSLNGNDWQCLNNHHPVARDVQARIIVTTLANGQRRIVAGGWDGQNLGPKYLQFSDDEGATWQTPSGLPDAAWYRRTLATPQGTIFHMVRSDISGSPRMVIYRSTDAGNSFSPWYSHALAQGDHDRQCDMWIPADSDTIFAVFEDRFVKIDPNGNAQTGGLISNKPTPEWAIMTGGRSHTSDPFTLYVRIWDGVENGIYRSVNGGQNWEYWGALVEGGLIWPFSSYAFVTNPEDPTKVYSGGWIVGVSEDGASWHYPHDLGGYVGYHGDVPEFNFVKNPNNGEMDLYIGTDGGFYKYQPQADAFASITTNTLGNTQIYKMASSHTDEYKMYIGTQDNGFNFNNAFAAPESPAAFDYLWGGDVTQLVSGDGGKSFWCFWIGGGGNFVQTASDMTNTGISNGGPLFDVGYWEMPAAADPLAPRECLVAGYRPADTNVSLLSRLKAPASIPDGQVIPFDIEYGTFDFRAASGGGAIGAIGISPIDNKQIYVMTDNGVFFWTLNKGQTWQKNESAKNKIYPRYIKVSPTNPGEVFIGGAAYDDNTPCWRTTNHGASLTAAEDPGSSVLKNNRVNALCFDPAGKYVFAAADIGAFVFEIAIGKWHFIGGNPAPVSTFHDVEYLENTNTVRFATYSRGVWDFKIEGLVSSTKEQADNAKWRIFPNPCSNYAVVAPPKISKTAYNIEVYNEAGQLVHQQKMPGYSAQSQINTSSWRPGKYSVALYEGTGKVGQVALIKQ